MHQGRSIDRATRPRRRALILGILLLNLPFAPQAGADGHAGSSVVLEVARRELERSMSELGKQDEPPYFLAYEINDTEWVMVSGSFGELVSSTRSRARQLDIDLRVGDHELDSSRVTPGGPGMMWGGFNMTMLPIEDDPAALQTAIWFHTDVAYKQAVEALTRIRTDVNIQVDRKDPSDDFSREESQHFLGELVSLDVDREAWERRVESYTAPFAEYGEIFQAQAALTATANNRWLVNSDGTELQTGQVQYRLDVQASTRAEDGMELPLYRSFAAFDLADLPGDEEIRAVVDKMISDLLALRDAPLVEPYVGPAILSGRAAGVFFHEVLGHRVEGHKLKRESDSQTFKKMVGESVLPPSLSITFDPTRRERAGAALMGHYRFDNEGVPAQPVTVVENGLLRNFLMSRDPIEGFPNSNGHGRRQPGFKPVARQSNLLVETSAPVSDAQLEAMLLERIREEGKPFGLIFEDIQGGFTQTGRFMPNAFNVLPLLVYRLFPDGTRELVRGVDLIGTPLTALTKIVATGDTPTVFNGLCGAESGQVPVSASSPALLISQIEVQKKFQSQQRLPILDAPLDPGRQEVRR
jgi:predicted Zn-dependent protease